MNLHTLIFLCILRFYICQGQICFCPLLNTIAIFCILLGKPIIIVGAVLPAIASFAAFSALVSSQLYFLNINS